MNATVITAAGETPIRRNAPADPFEAFKLDLDDLFDEAKNFLDGEPIASQKQADDVSALVNRLRRSINGADEYRKAEKKPHDDAAQAVQDKWIPTINRARLALTTAKNALAAFLAREDAAQRAAAEAAAQEARERSEAAAQAARETRPDDLDGQAKARELQETAEALAATARRLDKARPQARGGERAVGLKSRWTAILDDPVAALRHYRQCQPEALKQWLLEQGQADVRAGSRKIPGFRVEETKIAV